MKKVADRFHRIIAWINHNGAAVAAITAAIAGLVVLISLDIVASRDINPFFWVISNALLVIVSAALTFYVIFYFFWFKWWEHAGGRLIMAFTSSLLGVIFLVLVGLTSNPAGSFAYPVDTLVWRPFIRMIVYGAVAFTIIRLDVTLIARYRAASTLEFAVEPRAGVRSLPLLAPTIENSFVKPRKPTAPR